MLATGSKIGPYEILLQIGTGGMGEVYSAKDGRLKRDVAIKILPKEAIEDPDRQKRFRQEAQAASALNHPNILTVFDIGIENEIPYIVSELVDGTTLRKHSEQAPLPAKRILDIAVQIADGLSAAHEAGIVHRDLKPENIILTKQDRIKILDFGLAKFLPKTIMANEETISRVFTQTGVIRGTIPYMSPEQASGKPLDFRSDQFSFGLILYELATGRRAFEGATAAQTLSAIIADEAKSISELNPKIPSPLRWVIERCLTKEAANRYDSTRDLHRELKNLAGHLSETSIAADHQSHTRKVFWPVIFASIVRWVFWPLTLPENRDPPWRPRRPQKQPSQNFSD